MRTALAHHAGIAAEALAARRYLADGGRVRDARWRCPEGELDLVVEIEDGLVFVEVKARRCFARAAVSARQRARIGAAALRYLAERTDGTVPCRFDVVTVDRSGRPERIENAFSFDDW